MNWSHGFPAVSRETGERFAPVLAAWNADAGLGQTAFHDRYLGFDAGYHAVPDLRRAAALSRQATTFNDMADAAEPFAAAVRTIGSRHSWPSAMERLEERANQAITQGKVVLAGYRSDGSPKTPIDKPISSPIDALRDIYNRILIGEDKNLEGPLGEIAREVNPTNGDKNCAYIAYAVVARLRGIDPKAVAPAGAYNSGSEKKIDELIGKPFLSGSFEEIFEHVIRGGDGAIAIIRIKFPGRVAHVVVMANFKGQVGIIEAQRPKQLIIFPEDADAYYNPNGNNSIGYRMGPK